MSTNVHYIPNRLDWLARVEEPVLEPELPIVDPHHHLWDRPGWRYLLDEILADIASGHDIRATVLVQARAFHRADGRRHAGHPRRVAAQGLQVRDGFAVACDEAERAGGAGRQCRTRSLKPAA